MIPLNANLSAGVTSLSLIQIEVSILLINTPLGVVAPVEPAGVASGATPAGGEMDSHTVWKVPSYRASVALLANATSITYFVFGRNRIKGRPFCMSLTVTAAPELVGQ